MTLFILENNKIKLNTLEVLLFEEFRILWDRDETNDKSQVFKEFNFIYQYCDLKSAPNKDGSTDDKLMRDSIDIARLDETWRPDIYVQNAMKLYIERTPTISSRLLQQVLISMNFSVTILEKLRKQVGKKLEQEAELTVDEIVTLETALDKILSVAGSFTKNMKVLKETEALVKQEESGDMKIGRGGSEISESMNPETSM